MKTFGNLTVCYYYVTYLFQGESTLYSCLNFKEPLSRNRYDIWSLNGSSGNRTYNHLNRKWTPNHLAKLPSLDKWLSVRLRTRHTYRRWNGVVCLRGSNCGFESRCCHLNFWKLRFEVQLFKNPKLIIFGFWLSAVVWRIKKGLDLVLRLL